LIIEAVIQALSSGAFVVPGALGVQEGGFLAIGTLLGLSPELALALALMRRARDVLIFLPALLIWQVAAGRRALSAA
jgi:glycosyltransferase 2 family protein